MKKNNKILLIVIAIVLGVTILISLIYMFINNKNSIKNPIDSQISVQEVSVYYLNSIENELFYEKKEVDTSSHDIFLQLFDFMRETPKTISGISVVPKDLDILSFQIHDDTTLSVNFSKEYNNMKETEEIFFRSAFVWTVTELDYIENVEISVENELITKGDGEFLGLLNRENIILNPTILPEKVETELVTLYFSDEQEMYLVPEERLIEVKQSQTLEIQIVEQLIYGPEKEGHYPTVPPETKIRNIKTEGGICYVDLSMDFVKKHTGGSTAELFTIYSIVNSLTELEDVNKVQFLIEGEKISIYKNSLDISKPLDRGNL